MSRPEPRFRRLVLSWEAETGMAPERLLGKKIRLSSDIYSFAVTIYEVRASVLASNTPLTPFPSCFMVETPFADLPPSELRDLVVNHNHRPERPEEEDLEEGGLAVLIPDDLWRLTERCWAKEPKDRPTADRVCEGLMLIVETRSESQPPPSLPPHPVVTKPREPSDWEAERTVTLAPPPSVSHPPALAAPRPPIPKATPSSFAPRLPRLPRHLLHKYLNAFLSQPTLLHASLGLFLQHRCRCRRRRPSLPSLPAR